MGSSIPPTLKGDCDKFFASNAKHFDMAKKEECGRYMEALIPHLQDMGYRDVGFLKKSSGQTHYNLHAIDAIAYDLGGNLTHAIDVIARAEQPHPWKGEVPGNPNAGNDPPGPNFSEDKETAYKTTEDWLSEPWEEPEPIPDTVAWASYWGDPASDVLMRTLMYDFSRKPEAYNPGMGRWISRCVHTAFLGPIPPSQGGTPLGVTGALARHRPEWCAALGGLDPHVPVPDNFFPEWK